MRWRLPVVTATGPDHDRSAAGRVTLDALFIPTAWLGPHVTLLGWLAFHRNALEAKGADLDAEQLATRSAREREKQVADERIGQHAELGSVGAGNGYSLRWNLQKLVGEYARHKRTCRSHP